MISTHFTSLAIAKTLINLCKKIGISRLYDAGGASKLLDCTMFNENNIDIMFQAFKHPYYRQLHGKFIPYLSVIDLLFNEGNNSIDIIKSGRSYNRHNDIKQR